VQYVPGLTAAAAAAAPISEDDAYWNSQPAAVQVLRNMDMGPEKYNLATQLAAQGYSIDTQIMLWGWDPQMTMTIRQEYGYTWVPSWGQPAITQAPGVSDPLSTGSTYNPDAPPPGSIKVTTAFATGTIQNQVLLNLEAAEGVTPSTS
jgi:hypothetical protein